MKFLLLISKLLSQCINSNSTFEQIIYTRDFVADYNIDHITQRNGILGLRLDRTGGTRISSKSNLLYGTAEARIRIPMGSNVITSFILMAENGDEIDFEFVGKDYNIIQTNYFYRGIRLFDVNAKMYVAKNLTSVYNTFTINWTRDFYEWKFNGMTLRKLFKNETDNYPETTSKVQLGIWNAASSSWAGDGIDWSRSPYNYYVDYISINCQTVIPFPTTTTRDITATTNKATRTATTSLTTNTSDTPIADTTLTTPTKTGTTATSTSTTTTSNSMKNNINVFISLFAVMSLL